MIMKLKINQKIFKIFFLLFTVIIKIFNKCQDIQFFRLYLLLISKIAYHMLHYLKNLLYSLKKSKVQTMKLQIKLLNLEDGIMMNRYFIQNLSKTILLVLKTRTGEDLRKFSNKWQKLLIQGLLISAEAIIRKCKKNMVKFKVSF